MKTAPITADIKPYVREEGRESGTVQLNSKSCQPLLDGFIFVGSTETSRQWVRHMLNKVVQRALQTCWASGLLCQQVVQKPLCVNMVQKNIIMQNLLNKR